MDGNVKDLVECYSGHEYAERPLAFTWQGERMKVDKIVAEAVTPNGKSFKVTAENGQQFTLRYDQQNDCWMISPG